MMHVGRSWAGHPIEDECPCPQAACGLVPLNRADPNCEQHGWFFAKTMRQNHQAADCAEIIELKRKERAHWERSLERARTTHP